MVNPKLLIFDEATSSLDAESEAQVQQAISNLTQKGHMTLILIAHRLSTVVDCPRILVIQNGAIVEEGNHKSLRELNGVYKSLVEKQFAGLMIE